MPRDLFKSHSPTLGVGALQAAVQGPQGHPSPIPRPARQSARSSAPFFPEAAAARETAITHAV